MQFYLTNAFFPWNQQDQVNLSQNTCTSSPKTPPCPYARHLSTSLKPLQGPFEPRLWTQPKKKHTRQWSHPTTHRHLWKFGPDVLGRCDPAHCNLYDTPFPLRRRPTRRCASEPPAPKKNNERNMRCLVANGWLENQMSRSCNQNQERKSQTITMWWFQQLYAYFSRDKSLHHKFLYFSTGCVFFRILEKWKVIIKKNHSSKKSAKSHQPYKLLRTGVAFPAFLSCGKEKV